MVALNLQFSKIHSKPTHTAWTDEWVYAENLCQNCIMLHVKSLSGIIGIYWSRSLFIKYHLWSDEMAKEEEWLTFDSLQYLSLSGSFRLPLSYTFIIGTAHRIRCILSKLAIGSWWWRTTNEWIDCIESSVHKASQQLHCILRISGV